MLYRLLIVLLAATLMAGAAQTKKKAAPAAKAPAAKAPTALTIPAGAVEVEPGIFQHKGKDGKVWNYRHSPFGVVRFPPQGSDDEILETEAGMINVTEKGDIVHFERTTPFGKATWSRPRSELSGAELIAWKRYKGEAPIAKPSTTAAKPSN